jgi:exosortase/archaeosortase family protein
MLSLVPIAILKNGFRIASLSILGVYVDERILGSDLHRRGGILFFILALVLVWAFIVLLRIIERRFAPKEAKQEQ